MQKILIIGSLGMLGQELLKIFPQATGWDRDKIDITNKKQTEEKILALQPDVIINTAAYNAVDKCETKEGFAIAKKINGTAVGYLAKICLDINATFVHYSTGYVFNGEKKEGYQENDIPNPVNKYAETKLMGEQEILKYPELKYYIIRTSKLFGHKGSSEMAKNSFFDLMIDLSKNQKEVKAVDKEYSNFTYAPDLALATKNILTQKYANGIYHIVNEKPATWYEGARKLFDILKTNVKLIPVESSEFPRPAKRPRYDILINTKLPELRNYEEALKEYLCVE